jgi:hypothetical protein
MISFRNIPHALATFFKAVASNTKKIEGVIEGVEAHKTEINAIADVAAGAIGGAPAVSIAELISSAAFAALGSIDAALKSGDAAAEQKLLDAGLDQAAIDAVKQVGVQSKAVYTVVKAATK